nr:MAG TPA: adenylate kinase [Caudoviricetes sp.]
MRALCPLSFREKICLYCGEKLYIIFMEVFRYGYQK